MENERTIIKMEEAIIAKELLGRLLDRPCFAWPEEKQTTIKEKITLASQQEAEERIKRLKQESTLSSLAVLERIEPRVASWEFVKLLNPYKDQSAKSLQEFLEFISQQETELLQALNQLPPDEQPSEELVSQKWVASTLAYETRAAIRRKKGAEQEIEGLRQEVLSFIVKQLKETPDEIYSDQFDRLVCSRLDSLEAEGQSLPTNQAKLAYAENVIKKELASVIDEQAVREFLYRKIKAQKEKKLQSFLSVGIERLQEPEKTLSFAAVMFEIDERSTDSVWQKSKLQKVIATGLNGETITLISMACCINQYDFAGSFGINPNLFAYLENQKLEPVPLIIDELIATRRFLEFYGITVNLTIFTPDTEYTEVGKFGEVTSELLRNLEIYVLNLREYVSSKDRNTQVFPISSLTGNNPLYRKVQARVLEKVTKWKDSDFERKWYRKFEEDQERDSESQTKRKVFPPNIMRRKSLEITRKRWAVMAAEGAVFTTFGPNTIFISQERRERDIIYKVDEEGTNFPPVIYILKAAEMWNRKFI